MTRKFQLLAVLPDFVWSGGSIRALSSSGPALPYIARLSVLSRLIWPSACPLLHGSSMALLTALMSLRKTRANRMIGMSSDSIASSIHASSGAEPIAGSAFKEATEDFRNAYNHRFSSRFLIGMSAMVTRIVCEDGHICYGIGGSEPLNLNQVAGLLAIERDHCYRAFAAFQALVAEHSAAIAAFDCGSEGSLVS